MLKVSMVFVALIRPYKVLTLHFKLKLVSSHSPCLLSTFSVVPANITGPPQSVVVSIFGTATFTCTAEGFGLPVVSWGRLQNVDILNMSMP